MHLTTTKFVTHSKFLPLSGLVGLSESNKKGKLVTKIFFQIILSKVLKSFFFLNFYENYLQKEPSYFSFDFGWYSIHLDNVR